MSANALMASGVYFWRGFFECWYLSVLQAAVVIFLCTQDNPNSFHSPLSPDLNKGVTVVPLHEVLQAVKPRRWRAAAGTGAGNLGSSVQVIGARWRVLHETPNLTVKQLSNRGLASSRADLLPWGFWGLFWTFWVASPDKKGHDLKSQPWHRARRDMGGWGQCSWNGAVLPQSQGNTAREGQETLGGTWQTEQGVQGCAFTACADVHPKEFTWVCPHCLAIS